MPDAFVVLSEAESQRLRTRYADQRADALTIALLMGRVVAFPKDAPIDITSRHHRSLARRGLRIHRRWVGDVMHVWADARAYDMQEEA